MKVFDAFVYKLCIRAKGFTLNDLALGHLTTPLSFNKRYFYLLECKGTRSVLKSGP